MEFDLYWQAERWLALEHLRVRTDTLEICAEGLIVGSFERSPLRLSYQVVCDPTWRTRAVRVEDLNHNEQVDLQHPCAESWRDSTGSAQLDLDAAIDIDIAATPFTNTLPIRRLGLQPGQTQEITVVYIAVAPGLSFRPVRQRYTRLPRDGNCDRYLYESLESDFKRELVVDPNGFVIDYPGIWRRAAIEERE